MRVSHRQVEAFNLVMYTRSMTKTANAMSVTQSAVSKILRELQDAVGFPLFLRTKGGIEPSPEAIALYAEVERSFTGLERIERAAERIAGRRAARGTGVLRIAALANLSSFFIPGVLKHFLGSDHGVDVILETSNSWEIASLVAGGHVDIGFVMPPVNNDGVTTGKSRDADCVAAIPVDHRLASQPIISLRDFEGENFISMAEGTSTRMMIDSAFQRRNMSRSIRFETRWSVAAAALVSEGMGVSIVEPFTARGCGFPGVVIKPMKEKLPFSFLEIFPKGRPTSALTAAFLEVFDAEFRSFLSQPYELQKVS